MAFSQSITAGGADQLAAMLQDADRQMVLQLVAHIQRGFGGAPALAAEGQARCALLGRHPGKVGDRRGGQASKAANKWLRSFTSMYAGCHASASVTPFLKALIKRFEQDSRMEPAEAYALCLIDGVADMPALQSRASATAELTNEGKDFRLAA